MASVFKNPLTTPVGQRLNTAISHGQSSIDYPLVMEMCDLINDTDHGPKDAKSAFKKLIFANKDPGQVLQTLAILDMCIKNCQKRFHKHMVTKDFVVEIAKLAQSSKTTHNAVREKCLLLIQSWADTYRGKEDMGVAAEIYDQLKNSGVEFPAVDLDDMVPVRTPPSRQTAVPATQSNLPFSQPSSSYPRQPQPVQPVQPVQAIQPVQQLRHPQPPYPFQPQQRPYAPQQQAASHAPRSLTSEQITKILSEADVVETNIQVLSDLMLNSVPGQDKQDDIDFMQNLKDTIQKMQTRVMDLLSLPNSEQITARLLQLNDNINNVFTRHERFVRQTQAARDVTSSQRPIHIPEEPTPDTGISYPTFSSSTPDPQMDNPPDAQFTLPTTQPTPAAPVTQPTPAAPVTQPAPAAPVTQPTPAAPVTQPAPAAPAPDPMSELLLLDFGSSSHGVDDTPIIQTASQPAAPPTADTESSVDEFDIFAKSRQNTYATEFDTTSYSDTNQQSSASLSEALHPRSMSPEDAEGLHEWLAATNLTTEPPAATQTTSEEFDQFLDARINAASKSTSKPKKSKDKLDTADEMFSL